MVRDGRTYRLVYSAVAKIQRNHHYNTAKKLKSSCLKLNYPNHLTDLTHRYLLYTI